MKRQYNIGKIQKYGFTMIEIMLVIAMIGIFVAATNTFNWTPQTDVEKVNRIKNAVWNLIRDENLKVSIGRMPMDDWVVSAMTTLTIGTGWIITNYTSSWGFLFYTGQLRAPYFDNDAKYTINSVSWWTGSSNATSTWNGTGKVIITQDGITFTGNTNITNQNIILSIKVWYGARSRQILLDKRTGKITVDS